MKTTQQLDPTIFAIFGGAGDLTWRKLVPALFDLSADRSLPAQFAIIVVDRAPYTDNKLRQRLHDGVNKFSRFGRPRAAEWKQFEKHVSYLSGDFKASKTYAALGGQCSALEKTWGAKAHRIFYMATPPSLFGEIPKYLGKAGLARDRQYSRIVIEKPIGYDLESARALNDILSANFAESQIYRIDHYLGKETVQNMLAFRFANPLFEPIWNRRYVDYVTITVAEEVGVEHRGGYYDHAGALRDMVQNHLMQLLCLVAMEPMVSFEADEIRNKKVDVLHAIRPIRQDAVHLCAIRGQYGPGTAEGARVPGYRQEDGVSPESNTETFAALKLFIDNWRWQDVPFYLRTGKRLPRQVSEVAIQFRAVPHRSFPPEASLGWQPSRLVMSIQPDEGIVLGFQAKYPGPKMQLRPVDMRFNYRESFAAPSPDAYETLLWDLMKNDATLFMRADQVDAAWRAVMPILDAWTATPPGDFPNYAAGTWGPEDVQSLLAEGHAWPMPTELLRPKSGEKVVKKTPAIKALFVDIGGVLLTDGWDGRCRRRAAKKFRLDLDELEDRHHLNFDTYEEGKLTLEEYLDRVIFYRRRSFTPAQFRAFMFAQSTAFPEMIGLVRRLKAAHRLKVGVVSNEGRELNAHRIRVFRLDQFVDFFISSSYVHLRKPDADIFRMALDVGQVPAHRVAYLEDRAMFVRVAQDLGIRAVHHTGYHSTRAQLAALGLRDLD